jgi:hypothetical protein
MDRSELAQNVGANDLAESFLAFNTNYRDSGLFGMYAVAKVCGFPFHTILYYIDHVTDFCESGNYIYHALFSRLCLQSLSPKSAKWCPFNVE